MKTFHLLMVWCFLIKVTTYTIYFFLQQYFHLFFILLKSLSFHLFLRQEKQKQHFIECFLSFSSLKLSNKVHIPNTKWVLIFRLRLKVICNLFYFLNYLLDFSHKYLPCLHAWQQCKKFTYPI